MSEQFDIQGQVIVNTGDAEAALKKLRDKEAADNKAAQAAQLSAMSKLGTAAVVAGAALIAGVTLMVKESASAETAQKSLALGLQNTGQYSAATMKRIEGLTNSLRKQTTVSEETQMAALTFAGTMHLTEAQAEALLPRMLDLSAVTGMDLQQAFRASAQAMDGNVGLFQRYGVIIKKNADGTVNFSELLKQLGVYEGQAAEKMSGMEGAGKKLASAVAELGKSMGKTLIPELTKAFGSVTSLVEKFNEAPDAMKTLIMQSTLVAGGLLLIGGTALKTIVGLANLKIAIDTLTAGTGWAALMKFFAGAGTILGAGAAMVALPAAAMTYAQSESWAAEREKILSSFTRPPAAGMGGYVTPVTGGRGMINRGVVTPGMTRPSRTWTEEMRDALILSNTRPTPTLEGFSAEQIATNLDIQHQIFNATHTEKEQELNDLDLLLEGYRKAGDDKVLIAQLSASRRAEIEKKYAKEAAWSPINVSGVNVTGLSAYIGSLQGTKVRKEELQLTLKVDGTSIKVDQSALAKLKETLGALVFAKVMTALGGTAAYGG